MTLISAKEIRNRDFAVRINPDGSWPSYEAMQVALLTDIRHELRTIRRLLECQRFLAIPSHLDAIRRNTAKRPRKKPGEKPGNNRGRTP